MPAAEEGHCLEDTRLHCPAPAIGTSSCYQLPSPRPSALRSCRACLSLQQPDLEIRLFRQLIWNYTLRRTASLPAQEAVMTTTLLRWSLSQPVVIPSWHLNHRGRADNWKARDPDQETMDKLKVSHVFVLQHICTYSQGEHQEIQLLRQDLDLIPWRGVPPPAIYR